MEVPQGATLLEAVQNSAADLPPDLLPAPCGGQGKCGRCRVKLPPKSPAPEPTSVESGLLSPAEILAGYRLACQLRPESDLTVFIPDQVVSGMRQLQVEGLERPVTLDPDLKRYRLDLGLGPEGAPPAWREVVEGLARGGQGGTLPEIDLELCRQSEMPLKPGAWYAALTGGQVVGLSPASDMAPLLGMAVDLGTTKVAGYLMDLESGGLLASAGRANPQLPFGEDVISRLGYARQGAKEAAKLARLAADGLYELAAELAEKAGQKVERILEMVVAGNTAMHHLALGLPVAQLVSAPYLPALTGPMWVKARELGIAIAPGASVYFMPNIAGFVGGDAVAMSLAAGLDIATDTVLGIDIGTNTELVLSHQGQLICASCPSGPAFEGGRISCGIRAASGAVSECRLGDGGEIRYCRTLDEQPPVGLCGSGLLDLAAELTSKGIISRQGMLDPESPRVREAVDGGLEYLFLEADRTGHGREISISQADLSELQLAKGAVYSGIKLLLRAAGLKAAELERVVVAGAFGNHLDLEQAMRIGMLPRLPLERYQQVGNAAGSGARLALVSRAERLRATELAARTRHLELTSQPGFSQVFAKSLLWGEADE